jgi:hypothetical protein
LLELYENLCSPFGGIVTEVTPRSSSIVMSLVLSSRRPFGQQTRILPAEPTHVASNRRFAQRKPCQTPATIVFQGMRGPVACTVRDTSSSGALIEMVKTKGNPDGVTGVVPDLFVLVFNLDRSEINCQVAWRDDTEMGVRYISPARHTVKPKPKRPIGKR